VTVIEAFDPALEEQVTRARERQHRDLSGREAFGRTSITCLVLLGALALALFADRQRQPGWWAYPAFLIAYALVSSIRFELGSGVLLPTELVFVPMLFTLPAAFVPLVVAGGMVLANVRDVARGRLSPQRLAVLPASAVFAFGPAAIFLAAHEPSANWHGGAVLGAAVAAQFASDLVGSAALERLALGISPLELIRPLAWTFSIDALVAPFAFGLAVAEQARHGALVLGVPLVALLGLFARERRERLDSILELSGAYRGTAFLLGDVTEADGRTAVHCVGRHQPVRPHDRRLVRDQDSCLVALGWCGGRRRQRAELPRPVERLARPLPSGG
jgi:hypothetical protein